MNRRNNQGHRGGVAPQRDHRGMTWLALGAVVVVATLSVGSSWSPPHSGATDPVSTVTTSNAAAVAVGNPDAFTKDSVGHIWVGNTSGQMTEIDKTAAIGHEIIGQVSGLDGVVFALVSVGTKVYGLTRSGTLYVVDPAASGGPAVVTSLSGLDYGNFNYLYGGMTVLDDKIWLTTVNGATEVDPSSPGGPAVVTTVTGIGYPAGIASDGTSIWTTDGGDKVYEIDPAASGGPAVVASLTIPATGNGMKVDAITAAMGKIWVLDSGCGAGCQVIDEIDPAASGGPAVINTIPGLSGLAPYGQTPLVAVGSELWVAQASAHNLVIDPTAAGGPIVTRTVDLPCWTNDLFSDGTDAWAGVTNGEQAALQIDPTLKTVTRTVIHGFEGLSNPGAMAMVGADVWVANGSGTISVLDPTDPAGPRLVSTVAIGSNVSSLLYDGTHVWAAESVPNGTITEVDPASAGGPTVLHVFTGYNYPAAMAVIGSKLWVADAGFYYDPGCAGLHEIDLAAAGGPTEVYAACLANLDKGAQAMFVDGTKLIIAMNGWGSPLAVVDTAAVGGPSVVATYASISGVPMVFDGAHLWYTTWANPVATLHEVTLDVANPIDPPTELQSIALTAGDTPGSITFDGAHIWVGTGAWLQGFLDEVDAQTGIVLQHIDVNTHQFGHYTPGYLIADGKYIVGSVSAASQVLAATVPTPLAPQSVTATPGDRSATISWDAPTYGGTAFITRYDVVVTPEHSVASSRSHRPISPAHATSPTGCSTTGANGSSCTVSNLRNGTTYSVSVIASNANGGGLATEVTVTPAASTPPTTSGTGGAGGSGGSSGGPTTSVLSGPASTPTMLASTGASTQGLCWTGALLLFAGAVMGLVVRPQRRRRPATPTGDSG